MKATKSKRRGVKRPTFVPPPFSSKHKPLLLSALCLAAAFAWLTEWEHWRDATKSLAFAVPVLLHGVIGWAFARSLLPGREPLVTAIGRHARGDLPPDMQQYTRGVTQLWALLFAFMLLLSLLLPFVSVALWSWCTNVCNYALFALVILLEYVCRRWRFPAHAHPDFVSYLQLLVRADVRRL